MKIGIIGAGKVGSTIATLLESCDFCDAVLPGDARADIKLAGLKKAAAKRLDATRAAALDAFVRRCDAIVSAVGTVRGELVQRSFVRKIHGDAVGGRRLSAIQLTTAAGLVAVLELFAGGMLRRGFVKQESLTLERFLRTQWGGRVYGPASGNL